MEHLHIRLRFSSVMKNISKNNLNYNLEIVPLVTSVSNIDKIKWNHEKDKIEYMFPVNHKIIIKKLKPNPEIIKMYYSCVDLLPSLISNVDIDAGDIYRIISDNNMILNKEKSKHLPPTDTASIDIKMNNTMHHVRKSTNSFSPCNRIHPDLSDYLITPSNVPVKLKTESVQIHEATENRSLRNMLNHANVDASTSTSMLQSDCNRKLYITLKYDNMQRNKANDCFNFDSLSKNRGSSLIANILQEINHLKYSKVVKTRTYPQYIVNSEFDEETLISNIRIQPEIRVAKFVEKLKKEIMPLKIILDNILFQCSLLGLYKISLTDNLLLDVDLTLASNQQEERSVERERNNNRVVYSIVFDE